MWKRRTVRARYKERMPRNNRGRRRWFCGPSRITHPGFRRQLGHNWSDCRSKLHQAWRRLNRHNLCDISQPVTCLEITGVIAGECIGQSRGRPPGTTVTVLQNLRPCPHVGADIKARTDRQTITSKVLSVHLHQANRIIISFVFQHLCCGNSLSQCLRLTLKTCPDHTYGIGVEA